MDQASPGGWNLSPWTRGTPVASTQSSICAAVGSVKLEAEQLEASAQKVGLSADSGNIASLLLVLSLASSEDRRCLFSIPRLAWDHPSLPGLCRRRALLVEQRRGRCWGVSTLRSSSASGQGVAAGRCPLPGFQLSPRFGRYFIRLNSGPGVGAALCGC